VTGDALGLRAGLGRPSIGFVAVCLGYFAIILDGSVLNVAVPAIRTDLHASLGGAQWVLNAYTLTLAGLLLTFGALGDHVGLSLKPPRGWRVGSDCDVGLVHGGW
jgi:MFS transporter, DHA2 family, methylenomycin A resistance protein